MKLDLFFTNPDAPKTYEEQRQREEARKAKEEREWKEWRERFDRLREEELKQPTHVVNEDGSITLLRH